VRDGWELGPFTRLPGAVVGPDQGLAWAAKDVFNPGGVVHDDRVCLLVRGEDTSGRFAGVSRIGLATSTDGVSFTVEPEPVIAPGDDEWAAWEAAGGCEDPRVVEAPDGGFVCLYTGFDGKAGTLMVATTDDLRTWTKHGPAFAGTPFARRSSKSGAVVTEVRDGRLVAARIGGRFWMCWGEGTAFAATSDDLVRWTPITFDATGDRYLTPGAAGWEVHRVPGLAAPRPVLSPRRGRFDSLLVEPGPPAVLTDAGIVLIVNGANHGEHGDPTSPALAYQPGQVLLDPLDPTAVLARTTEPFLRVGADDAAGQVGNVLFAQALVLFRDEWRLYLGLSDSRIGCATAPVGPGGG
jgi:predicted GH43/DUF377 family glycosyl hydrolase